MSSAAAAWMQHTYTESDNDSSPRWVLRREDEEEPPPTRLATSEEETPPPSSSRLFRTRRPSLPPWQRSSVEDSDDDEEDEEEEEDLRAFPASRADPPPVKRRAVYESNVTQSALQSFLDEQRRVRSRLLNDVDTSPIRQQAPPHQFLPASDSSAEDLPPPLRTSRIEAARLTSAASELSHFDASRPRSPVPKASKTLVPNTKPLRLLTETRSSVEPSSRQVIRIQRGDLRRFSSTFRVSPLASPARQRRFTANGTVKGEASTAVVLPERAIEFEERRQSAAPARPQTPRKSPRRRDDWTRRLQQRTPTSSVNGRLIETQSRPPPIEILHQESRRDDTRRVPPEETRRMPDDSRRAHDDGRRMPPDENRRVPPEDSRRLPDDIRRVPDDSRRSHDDGRRLPPEETRRVPPDESRRVPDESRRVPDDSRRAHDDGRRAHEDSRRLPPDETRRMPPEESRPRLFEDNRRALDESRRAPVEDTRRAPPEEFRRAPPEESRRAPPPEESRRAPPERQHTGEGRLPPPRDRQMSGTRQHQEVIDSRPTPEHRHSESRGFSELTTRQSEGRHSEGRHSDGRHSVILSRPRKPRLINESRLSDSRLTDLNEKSSLNASIHEVRSSVNEVLNDVRSSAMLEGRTTLMNIDSRTGGKRSSRRASAALGFRSESRRSAAKRQASSSLGTFSTHRTPTDPQEKPSRPSPPLSSEAATLKHVMSHVPSTQRTLSSSAFDPTLVQGPILRDLRARNIPVHSVLRHSEILFTLLPTPTATTPATIALPGASPSDLLRRGHSLCRINSGTFCSVFRARYRGTDVAVKCPDENLLKTDGDMMRFRALQEWRILARTNHPRILSFHGGVILRDQLWLVTDFVKGGDLYTLLYHRPPEYLRPKIRLSLMEQLCEAVSYLHGLKPRIAHKDLKCNNLLVGDDLQLRVCDFGDAEEMTGAYLQCCTAATWQYTPPELIGTEDPSRPKDATEKVDIWAMGCVFLEILRCSTPFVHILDSVTEDRQRDILRQCYLEGRLEQECRVPTHLPPKLRSIIKSCLNFDAYLRPSAAELLNSLRASRDMLLAELCEWQDHWEMKPERKPIRSKVTPTSHRHYSGRPWQQGDQTPLRAWGSSTRERRPIRNTEAPPSVHCEPMLGIRQPVVMSGLRREVDRRQPAQRRAALMGFVTTRAANGYCGRMESVASGPSPPAFSALQPVASSMDFRLNHIQSSFGELNAPPSPRITLIRQQHDWQRMPQRPSVFPPN